jgi:hypothetical protein
MLQLDPDTDRARAAASAQATAATVARSAKASTGTPPLPTAAAVPAPVMSYWKVTAKAGASIMVQPCAASAGRGPGHQAGCRNASVHCHGRDTSVSYASYEVSYGA